MLSEMQGTGLQSKASTCYPKCFNGRIEGDEKDYTMTHATFDRFLSELIDGLAAVGIMGASIILLVSLWGIYRPQIRAFLLAAQTMIFGG